jgi:hypothetical protein
MPLPDGPRCCGCCGCCGVAAAAPSADAWARGPPPPSRFHRTCCSEWTCVPPRDRRCGARSDVPMVLALVCARLNGPDAADAAASAATRRTAISVRPGAVGPRARAHIQMLLVMRQARCGAPDSVCLLRLFCFCRYQTRIRSCLSTRPRACRTLKLANFDCGHRLTRSPRVHSTSRLGCALCLHVTFIASKYACV